MPTANDVTSQMVDALRLTEPGLDTSIGSVVRKILDAVSGTVVEAYSDQQLSRYAYDIDSKTAGDLDDFVALFGMARSQPQRATGVVTFTRPSSVAVTRTAVIPTGTQVLALSSPPVYVQTITSGVMGVGQTSIDLPVQAVLAGPQGNVAAGLLVNLASNVDGVTNCTNNSALAFGSAAETDAQLRAKWKSTVFRNLAGTESMYRAMGLQTQADPSDPTSRAVTQCVVLGPKKTWVEQVAVVNGVANSSLNDAAYIYPRSVYVGANISSGNFLQPGAQYATAINNNVSPATLQISEIGTGMPDGLYDLQLDYVPSYSRNDPLATRWGVTGAFISNRIDMWVNGRVARTAVQACNFNSGSTQRFNSAANDPLKTTRWITRSGAQPSVNDVFIPLGFGPILSVPASLPIGGTTYSLGTHYDIAHQNDAFGYAPNSRFGLVWFMAGPAPASGTAFSLTYLYNEIPALVQRSIEGNWRLVGTDVWVHAGKATSFRINVAVVFDRNADQSATTTAINSALSGFINTLGFNSALQVSDILQVIHNVSGVDNVRFLNSTDDGVNYGIQPVTPAANPANPAVLGAPYQSGGRAVDVYFNDATYPLFDSVRIVVKAKNTFGTP